MDNKKQIDVRIADLAPIPIRVGIDEVASVRKAEENVTHLWNVWKKRYGSEKSHLETMAMVAFQFAKLYYADQLLKAEASELLQRFEENLDSIILKDQ